MKLNWGTGIVISIIIFMAISLVMLFIFMNQKVDLVTDNYYEKTLVYQNQIDEAERSAQFDKEIQMEYSDYRLKLVFPFAGTNKIANGVIYFYRPSNSMKDFKTILNFDEKGEQVFDVSKIDPGYWKLQMKWFMNNESFSAERTLMIN